VCWYYFHSQLARCLVRVILSVYVDVNLSMPVSSQSKMNFWLFFYPNTQYPISSSLESPGSFNWWVAFPRIWWRLGIMVWGHPHHSSTHCTVLHRQRLYSSLWLLVHVISSSRLFGPLVECLIRPKRLSIPSFVRLCISILEMVVDGLRRGIPCFPCLDNFLYHRNSLETDSTATSPPN